MPSSRILIASNTLTSSAASVTFSSIPSTYTDLVLRVSARNNNTGVDNSNLLVRFNSDSATNYSVTYIFGNGATALSSRLSSQTTASGYIGVNGDSTTANSFSSLELYIPSYNVAQNKPISFSNAVETNSTTAYNTAVAGLWRNTATIDSIVLTTDSSTFKSGSSFFLYGLKNS